jgi:hypothetical protein
MLRLLVLGLLLVFIAGGVFLQGFRLYLAWRFGKWSFRGSPVGRNERPIFYWALIAFNVAVLGLPLAGIAAGLITLPGIMTGQIIAGMDPMEAVKYQILLMFLLSGASGVAALVVAELALRRLSDARQRLRLDRLQ